MCCGAVIIGNDAECGTPSALVISEREYGSDSPTMIRPSAPPGFAESGMITKGGQVHPGRHHGS